MSKQASQYDDLGPSVRQPAQLLKYSQLCDTPKLPAKIMVFRVKQIQTRLSCFPLYCPWQSESPFPRLYMNSNAIQNT